MKSKNIVLIVTLVIVLLIVLGVVILNVNVLPYIKNNAKDIYSTVKSKIQIVNDLCGLGAFGVGISGFILYAKLSKNE